MNTITNNAWPVRIHRWLASAVIASALSCASAGTAHSGSAKSAAAAAPYFKVSRRVSSLAMTIASR